MSTHIETGFSLPTTDFSKILTAAEELRTAAASVAFELLQDYLLFLAVTSFDKACVRLYERTGVDFIANALEEINKDQKEAREKHIRNPSVDMSLSVTFFPREEETLGIAFAPNARILDLVKTLPGWKDFHYQDSTDKPDALSESQWKYRKKLWDEVLLDKSGIPEREGFTLKILPIAGLNRLWTQPEDPLPLNPFEKRVYVQASDLAIEMEMLKIPKAEWNFSTLMKLVRKVKELPGYVLAQDQALSRMIEQPTVAMLRGLQK